MWGALLVSEMRKTIESLFVSMLNIYNVFCIVTFETVGGSWRFNAKYKYNNNCVWLSVNVYECEYV